MSKKHRTYKDYVMERSYSNAYFNKRNKKTQSGLRSMTLLLAVVIVVAYAILGYYVQNKAKKGEIQISSPIYISVKDIPKTPEENLTPEEELYDHFTKPKPISGIFDEEDYDVPVFGSDITSQNAILIDLGKKQVLFERKADTRLYPASLTKVMTVYTAIELAEERHIDLEETTYTFPTVGIIEELAAQDASMAGFMPDETTRLIDLLYGAMLPSGADATAGLADYFSGSERAFADVMNEKIEEWGLTETHFVNTTGLHDPNHYTTAREMAAILIKALENPTFRKIFTEKDWYEIPPTPYHPEGLRLLGSLWQQVWGTEDSRFTIIGAKTGFTDEAGRCLGSVAVDNTTKKEYLALNFKGSDEIERPHIADSYAIYGNYTEMKYYEIAEEPEYPEEEYEKYEEYEDEMYNE